jgi:hypothetical protein
MSVNVRAVLDAIVIICAVLLVVDNARKRNWILLSAWACLGIGKVMIEMDRAVKIPDWIPVVFAFAFVVLVVVGLWKGRNARASS